MGISMVLYLILSMTTSTKILLAVLVIAVCIFSLYTCNKPIEQKDRTEVLKEEVKESKAIVQTLKLLKQKKSADEVVKEDSIRNLKPEDKIKTLSTNIHVDVVKHSDSTIIVPISALDSINVTFTKVDFLKTQILLSDSIGVVQTNIVEKQDTVIAIQDKQIKQSKRKIIALKASIGLLTAAILVVLILK